MPRDSAEGPARGPPSPPPSRATPPDRPPATRAERVLAERQIQRDLFIALLALVSVAIGVVAYFRPEPGFGLLDLVDIVIVLVFISDFVTSARASGNWRAYVRRHWWEVPSLVPITGGLVEGLGAYSLVRGVRLVRLVRVVRLIRVLAIAARFKRVRRYVRRVATRAQLMTLAWIGTLFVLAGAAGGYAAEGGVNPRLATFTDAVWWSLNLFTNVAYLDFRPVTATGRWIAGTLMVSGLAFIGVFTASLANAFLKEPGVDDETPEMEEGAEAPLD